MLLPVVLSANPVSLHPRTPSEMETASSFRLRNFAPDIDLFKITELLERLHPFWHVDSNMTSSTLTFFLKDGGPREAWGGRAQLETWYKMTLF